jgi:hypothetical protein
MNKPLFTLFILLSATCIVHAVSAETVIDGVPIPEEMMVLARKVVSSNSPKEALMRADNPFSAHPFFKDLVTRVNFTKVNENAAELMVQTFTRGEMYALVQFQGSAEGKSISAKMPAYQQMVGGLIQNELKTAMEGYLLTKGQQGAQSEGVMSVPKTAKPVVPWTPPTAPTAPRTPTPPILQGKGGSLIGQ